MLQLQWILSRRPRVAVVEISGMIGGRLRAEPYVELLHGLRQAPWARAVVLSIDCEVRPESAINLPDRSLVTVGYQRPSAMGISLRNPPGSRKVQVASSPLGSWTGFVPPMINASPFARWPWPPQKMFILIGYFFTALVAGSKTQASEKASLIW